MYVPTAIGGPELTKLSVEVVEPPRLLMTVELPALVVLTPIPAIPHVHGRFAKGLLPGSKEP